MFYLMISHSENIDILISYSTCVCAMIVSFSANGTAAFKWTILCHWLSYMQFLNNLPLNGPWMKHHMQSIQNIFWHQKTWMLTWIVTFTEFFWGLNGKCHLTWDCRNGFLWTIFLIKITELFSTLTACDLFVYIIKSFWHQKCSVYITCSHHVCD